MRFLVLPMPKTLVILLISIVKYITSFFQSNKKVHFDRETVLTAILYFISYYTFLKSAEHIGIIILAICTPIRVVFTFLLSKLFYSRKYTLLEYIALMMVFTGFAIASIKEGTSNTNTNLNYLLILLFGNLCNSLSCILFDKKIKCKNISYWNYMYTYSFLSLLIAITGFSMEYLNTDSNFIGYLSEPVLYFSVAAQTVEMFLIAYLSFQITPLERGLNHIVCAISITILTNLLFDKIPTTYKLIACGFTYLGLLIFKFKSIKGFLERRRPGVK